jgi:transposase
MPQLTLIDVGRIKAHYAIKGTIAAVVRDLGFTRRTVKRALSREETASIKRTRKVPPQVRKRRATLLRLTKLRGRKGHRSWPRYGSSKALRAALEATTQIRVSSRTVVRDLHALRLYPRIRPRVPTRDFDEGRKRIRFARKYRKIPANRLVFSDESWLSTNEHTGRVQWCRKGDAPLPLERKARWNVASIMIWAAVGVGFKSNLVIFPSKRMEDGEAKVFRLDAAAYVRRCLSGVVKSLRGKLFQQDGARAHVAGSTKLYLEKKKVEWMTDYPPYSPDFNMIEPIWKEMNDRVGQMCPLTQEELIRCAKKAWNELPQSVVDAHVRNFAPTLRRVIRQHEKSRARKS